MDDVDDLPWKQPWVSRRDCEPHRSALIQVHGGICLMYNLLLGGIVITGLFIYVIAVSVRADTFIAPILPLPLLLMASAFAGTGLVLGAMTQHFCQRDGLHLLGL